MALYRKWRPQKFSNLIGQEHIKRTLLSSLKSGKISHAYLFAGPKGSGKTTTARLLAKAVNCEVYAKRKTFGEPDDKCLNCKEIAQGRNLDVVEIDAASHTGVDNVRQLIDTIGFAPTKSRFKVYIIDEVHMLSKGAFNALLKTLEEPPLHVIFIMATTEPQKVPVTILSRSQRFDFHLAQRQDLVSLISQVARSEKIKIDKDAVEFLATLSEGSFRDALSLLDQLQSFAYSQITLKTIRDVLGLAQTESIFQFLEHICKGEKEKALKILTDLYQQGVNFSRFCEMLVKVLRDVLLFGANAEVEEKERISKLSQMLTTSQAILWIGQLMEISRQIGLWALPTLPLEIFVLEQTQNQAVLSQEKEEAVIKENPAPIKESLPEMKYWPKVIEKIKPQNHSLWMILQQAQPTIQEEGKLALKVKFKLYAEQIMQTKNKRLIEDIIAQILGQNCILSCVVDDNLPQIRIEEAVVIDGENLQDQIDTIF
jgi:DNA polymerase-3 subunit gamma/tau